MADNTVTIHINAKTGDAKKGIDEVQDSVGKLGSGSQSAGKHLGGFGDMLSSVGKIAGGFIAANVIQSAFASVTSFAGGSVKAAVGLGESLNAVNVIFKDSAKQVLDWGANNATQFGLSQREFNALATPLGALLKNSGMGLDDVAKNTINLTKRAADMASVFNTEVSDALNAINSGLRGEGNPLERYGVGLKAATVEARALAETGKGVAKELTEEELATARLNIIFEQTKDVTGDFANTSKDLANAQRIARAEMEKLQAQVGAKLIPVMLALEKAKLQVATAVVEKLLPALDRLAPMLGGIKDSVVKAAKPWLSVLLPAMKKVADFAKDEIGGEGVDKLVPFSAWASGASGRLTLGSTVREKFIPAFEDLASIVKKTVGLVKPLLDWEFEIMPTGSLLNPDRTGPRRLAEQVEAIRAVFETAGTAIKNVTGFLREHEDAVVALIAAYGAYKSVMVGAAVYKAVAAGIAIVTATTTTGLIPALIALAANEGIATAAQVALNLAMAANPIGVIAIAIAALVAVVVMLYLNFDLVTAAAGYLWDRMKEAGSGISKAWGVMVGFVTDKVTALWNKIKEIGTGISKAWGAMVELVTEISAAAWGAIVGFAGDKVTALWNKIKEVGSGISDAWGAMVWFVSDEATALWNKIKKIATGIYDAVVGAFHSMVDFVKEYWPEIISLILLPFFPIVALATDAFGIRTALGKAWDWISEKTKEAIDKIGVFLGYLYDHFYIVSNNVDFVVRIFTTLRDTVDVVWNTIKESIIGAVTYMSDFLSERFENIKDSLLLIWDTISTVISVAWDKIKEIVRVAGTYVSDFLSERFENIKDSLLLIWDKILTVILLAWDKIKEIVGIAVTYVSDFLSERFENIKDNLLSIWVKILTVILLAWDKIKEIVRDAVTYMSDFLSERFENIKKNLGLIWDTIVNLISVAWDKISTVISDAMSNLWDEVMKWVNRIVNLFERLGGMIMRALGSVKSLLYSVGRDIAMGIWEGLMSMWDSLIDAAKRLAQATIQAAKGIVGYHADPLRPKPGGSPTAPPETTTQYDDNGIPLMASGGVVRATPGGILARLGDGGQDEAVIPLNRSSAFGGTVINNYSITLTGVITDPVATGRAVADALNRASLITGPLLLSGAVRS